MECVLRGRKGVKGNMLRGEERGCDGTVLTKEEDEDDVLDGCVLGRKSENGLY